MSWDEKLFGLVYRAVRGGTRRAKGRRTPEELARIAVVQDAHGRLRLFASALAGMPVELSEAEGEGGTLGGAILLPSEIDVAPTHAQNASALLLRVAYAAVSVRLGFHWSGDPSLRGLATLLAVPATLAVMEAELPQTRLLRAELLPALLSARAHATTKAADDAPATHLEVLAQALLGRPWAELETDEAIASGAVAWAREALSNAATSPADLAAHVARHEARLPKLLRAPIAPVVLWGSLFAIPKDAGAAAVQPFELGRPGVRTERRAKPREGVRRIELKKDPGAENPITHSFEKLHTADEHRGGDKRADGSDELSDHAEALDELELREVVRSQEAAKSLYRADVIIEEGTIGTLDGGGDEGIFYDEWEEKTRRYKPSWCCVHAKPAPEPLDAAAAARTTKAVLAKYRRLVDALRGELEQLDCTRRWHGRQADGPEVDIDALVDRHATLKSGRSGPEKLYQMRKRHEQDVAVVILLDASLSTDAWVAGRRVIDVAKESITVLGSVLRDVRVDTAIGAFYSNTRRDCTFLIVKRFADEWPAAERRLVGVEPAGYTRIGPAVRHATHLLGEREARRKLLLLVSDGKPSDYDRYEGRYGIGDVRQAVREAKQEGITTFGLAIDGAARFYLPQMFGHDGYEVLPRPEGLVRAMARVYRDLLR